MFILTRNVHNPLHEMFIFKNNALQENASNVHFKNAPRENASIVRFENNVPLENALNKLFRGMVILRTML